MLLNLSVFMWFGAVCPWTLFAHNNVIPIYRLVILGILILLFRRVPIIYAMHWKIGQIEEKQQALFVGFFGPIGVSAVFYLYVTLDFLGAITVDGVVREDAGRLAEVMTVVIWFLAICSIVSHCHQICAKGQELTIQVVHGLSVPLGKLGYHLPRTISNVIETRETEEPEVFPVHSRVDDEAQTLRNRRRQRQARHSQSEPDRPVFRVGGEIIHPGISGSTTPRERTTHGVTFGGITRNNSTSGKSGETPASGGEGSVGLNSTHNVGTPVNGDGAPEQQV